MSSTPLDMGFLSSLVDIHFPSACGLIWVQMGVNPTGIGAQLTMTLSGGPLKKPFVAINNELPAGPLGSPATLAGYGGASILYPDDPRFSRIAANFFAFRIVGGNPVTINAQIGGQPRAPFCTLACGIISALDFSTLKLNPYNVSEGELSFSNGASNTPGTDAVLEQGGFEYLGAEVTYFGKIVTDFDQNTGAGLSNSFTFTRTSCSVTQN